MSAQRLSRGLACGLLLVLAACAAPPAHPPGDAAPAPPQPAPALEQAQPAAVPIMRSQFAPPMPPAWRMPAAGNENYRHYDDNPVHLAAEEPVSTFGLDVDTGAYTNVRRMLEQGSLPPADAVRTEEFVNYFDYGYAPPADRERPFAVAAELAPAPWNPQRRLLLIGIQGYRVPAERIPAANLVFLIDTSGSMDEPAKLPLLKASLKQLSGRLRARDRVAIVTYAGHAGVALASTPGSERAKIDAAIDALQAGGGTNGGAGLELAYAQAREGFVQGGVNRVLLATDGDFNVGTTNLEALKTRVAEQRRQGIALSTLGFGQGNYNDDLAVQLADVGDGSHHYIDKLAEGRRVLVDELSASLLTIAKDVKIQVEFNPAQVQEYRLIGYEKRALRREDFNDDQVDAGDIGAGANVTALYEIVPKGSPAARIDPLRYAKAGPVQGAGAELAYLRLRYKLPGQARSALIERPIPAAAEAAPGERLRFAAAVAAFAERLRGGRWLEGYDYPQIAALARGARGSDPDGYRAGFVQLVTLAGGLAEPAPPGAIAASQ